jgi:M6 family metalloprotease-like protein
MTKLIALSFIVVAFHLAMAPSNVWIDPPSYTLDYRTIRTYEGYRTATPSVGDVPVLIIPVSFSDYSCDTLEKGCDGTKDDIETTFFGQPDDLRWESVRSFYHASSYGQLSLYGTVTDWYTPSITAVQLSNQSSALNSQVTLPALAWFKDTYQTTGSEFDSDNDGYLDAVYFVYSVDFNPADDVFGPQKNVFWAFVSYIGGVANVNNPGMFHYGWSSVEFMYNDGIMQRSENGKVEWDDDNEPIFLPYRDEEGELEVNAHVFIHEFGHLLGLVDYYSYDRSLGDWGPLGALDMMDFNVGDHNAYSKSVLNWIRPKVVVGEGVITLRSFTETGDALLIRPTYRGTLLDEYILVEWYTPTGLNEKDAREPYAGRYPRQFSTPGLKIYHVDARVARYELIEGQWQFTHYVTDAPSTSLVRYDMAHANTASRSLNPNYKLIHLLERSGKNTFINGGFATNATLFQPGDEFSNYAFNGGDHSGYAMSILSYDEEGVQIRLERVD